MKWKPYPTYKDSGVEWLGQVPEHWEVKRLKTSADCWVSNVDKVPSEDELPVRLCNYTDVYYNDKITLDMALMETTATAAEIQKFGLKVDDVLITKDSESWSDIAVPALVAETAPNLVCGYHLGIIRPNSGKLSGLYLLRAMQSSAVNQQFQLAASGVTRYGLPKASMGEAIIPIPPLHEQTAIAEFLDRETGRIDELVGKKRELIERLKEKRSALISRTVTRGLPADLPPETLARLEKIAGEKLSIGSTLKPSGHPWVKDIPEHWTPERLKYVSTLFGRIGFRGYSTEDLVLEGEGAISMSPSNMVDGEMHLGKCTWLSWEKYHESPEIKIEENDVVMVKTGSTLGKVAFVRSVPNPMTINPQLMIFKKVKCSRRFLFYFVTSTVVQNVIPLHNTGSTIPTMTQEGIGKLPIPLPPFSEQRAVAAYLDEETAKIDDLIEKVETAIERLQEYRSALITAAVTGKMDVRESTVGKLISYPESKSDLQMVAEKNSLF